MAVNAETYQRIDALNRDYANKQEQIKLLQASLEQAKQEAAQAKFALDNFMYQVYTSTKSSQ